MNKKLQKAIKITIIAVIVMALIISTLASQDTHHLETCHEEHCSICALIQFAQAIITIIFYTFASLLSGFLIYFYLSTLPQIENIQKQNSLVFQKVQQNE